MNSPVRVEIFVPRAKTEANEFPEFSRLTGAGHEVRKWEGGFHLSTVTEDTSRLRAELVEFITGNPGSLISVVRLFRDYREQQTVQTLVANAFSQISEQPLSYNMKDAARRLGISYTYIKQLVTFGRLRRVNGRISASELDRYLKRPQ